MTQTQVRTKPSPVVRAINWAFCKTIGRKWIAGSTLEDEIRKAKDWNDKGVGIIGVFLGEHYTVEWKINRAKLEYHALLDRMKEEGIVGSVAIKLSQLGLDLLELHGKKLTRKEQEAIALRNVLEIVDHANRVGINVEFDIEDREDVDFTFRAYKDAIISYSDIRFILALQANVGISKEVLEELIALGLSGGTRLVYGIYPSIEPGLMTKPEILARYEELLDIALSAPPSFRVALGSHHTEMIRKYISGYGKRDDPKNVQVLQGIVDRDIPKIQEQGANVSVYLGYGDGFAYSFRRMMKNPGFIFKILTKMFRKHYEVQVGAAHQTFDPACSKQLADAAVLQDIMDMTVDEVSPRIGQGSTHETQ